ncbi:SurA N-terminal domain-containing protein [Methylocucumis oryzae]|uniref:SurA N-terminal domain-containing protein n=1 Tax=Methylocucumis oryzae TaxID=1632867 RepID=UPI001EF9EDC8|nr:SurA N-terminal domain-containing protein [Methylocucumis oryzae]
MLTTIREKSQGAFAWIILIVICVPFALWGINNYMDKGQESPVASVGSKDFYQRDVNKAYDQFSQNFRGLGIDEALLKQQALQKLIKDEVLLQYVQNQGLEASDASLREFIKSLPYFQTDGKFDEAVYKSILAQQRLSSVEFTNRIRNVLLMEQFQQSISGSAFATNYDVENFLSYSKSKTEY